jgi:hypothetical protein
MGGFGGKMGGPGGKMGGGGSGGSNPVSGLLGGLGMDVSLDKLPLIGNFFPSPQEQFQKQQLNAAAKAYDAYRPEAAQAGINALQQQLGAYQGVNNAMGQMYGPSAQQNFRQLSQNPMSGHMMRIGSQYTGPSPNSQNVYSGIFGPFGRNLHDTGQQGNQGGGLGQIMQGLGGAPVGSQGGGAVGGGGYPGSPASGPRYGGYGQQVQGLGDTRGRGGYNPYQLPTPGGTGSGASAGGRPPPQGGYQGLGGGNWNGGYRNQDQSFMTNAVRARQPNGSQFGVGAGSGMELLNDARARDLAERLHPAERPMVGNVSLPPAKGSGDRSGSLQDLLHGTSIHRGSRELSALSKAGNKGAAWLPIAGR